jgi:hypothetical protein
MFDKNNISPERQYNIVFKITDDEQKVVKFIDSYDHSGFSCNILTGFFDLVKNEALKWSFGRDETEQFTEILGILYARFSQEDVKKGGDLEEAINNFIDSLKTDKFYIPEELIGDNRAELTQINTDYYLCSLESLVSNIRNAIKSLREEKIQFWKELLEKYRKDKEGFDYEFKMNKLRTKEMEERISKLTPEDFRDLL